MRNLSAFDRHLFDWLGRRSLLFLAILPIAVFLAIVAIVGALISVIANRSPFSDIYAGWLLDAALIAGIALYVVALYSFAAVYLKTERFKLLELHQTMRDIRDMTWSDFERLVAAFYETKGYSVDLRGGDRPDGGIDLIVHKGNQRWIVQCKHWRDSLVRERPLRELLGVVTAQKATGGIFVACGVFDAQATAFAKSSEKLELIGGEQLGELIRAAVRKKETWPPCPSCGSPMNEKFGRYGVFLSCNNYPSCLGRRPHPSNPKPA